VKSWSKLMLTLINCRICGSFRNMLWVSQRWLPLVLWEQSNDQW